MTQEELESAGRQPDPAGSTPLQLRTTPRNASARTALSRTTAQSLYARDKGGLTLLHGVQVIAPCGEKLMKVIRLSASNAATFFMLLHWYTVTLLCAHVARCEPSGEYTIAVPGTDGRSSGPTSGGPLRKDISSGVKAAQRSWPSAFWSAPARPPALSVEPLLRTCDQVCLNHDGFRCRLTAQSGGVYPLEQLVLSNECLGRSSREH